MPIPSPVEVARRAIRPGSVLRAAMEAVSALMRAGLLDAADELAAGPLAWQAIVQAQAGAETYSHINPQRAAVAVVETLRRHNLLPQPGHEQLAIALPAEETAA